MQAVYQLILSQPLYFQDVLARNQQEFMSLIFTSDAVIVYADPKVHGHNTYTKVVEALCQACHDYNDRTVETDNPLVFVLTTRKDMQML